MANIKAANTASITSFNTNEKIVFETLKEKGFTDEGAAAVMGVVGGESGFKTFKELSYSTTSNDRIRAIFPTKTGNLSDVALNRIKADDKLFFDTVYGGMHGNAPDEGYTYVGRGFNGITFKGNYEAAQKYTGIGFVSNPKLMEEPENAAAALAWYFNVGTIKNSNNLETAFQEAYRRNAGGYSFATYANSNNIVNKVGIPLKWGKAQKYYEYIKSKAAESSPTA
jgi:predicted chitinase